MKWQHFFYLWLKHWSISTVRCSCQNTEGFSFIAHSYFGLTHVVVLALKGLVADHLSVAPISLTDAPFTGDAGGYKEWHGLMRYPLLGANQGYGRRTFEFERTMNPITTSWQQSNPNLPGHTCDLVWVTRSYGPSSRATSARPSGKHPRTSREVKS